MHLRSIFIGLVAAGALICVLALSRLMVAQVEVPDLMVRDIEMLDPDLPPPPPPAPDEPPPDPPLSPAIAELSDTPDPSRVPIPRAEIPMDVRMPVDTFFSDLPPAPLPVVAAPAPVPRADPPPSRPPPPRPPPPVRDTYSVGELDATPRLLRHGSAAFPPGLARQGITSGTVVLEVELSPRGAVTVRRVISSSHDELVAGARRIAAASRFTPPTRNGQAVSAVMRWPITINR